MAVLTLRSIARKTPSHITSTALGLVCLAAAFGAWASGPPVCAGENLLSPRNVPVPAIGAVLAGGMRESGLRGGVSGSVVGWGTQVVGVDLTKGFVSVAAGYERRFSRRGLALSWRVSHRWKWGKRRAGAGYE